MAPLRRNEGVTASDARQRWVHDKPRFFMDFHPTWGIVF